MISRPLTPYCVSRLIQIFPQCYRFYIYRKCPKINIFQSGRCTHAWASIVFLVGFAALWIFHSVKFNDSLFFSKAIVIFCTQGIITIFNQLFQLLKIIILRVHINNFMSNLHTIIKPLNVNILIFNVLETDAKIITYQDFKL